MCNAMMTSTFHKNSPKKAFAYNLKTFDHVRKKALALKDCIPYDICTNKFVNVYEFRRIINIKICYDVHKSYIQEMVFIRNTNSTLTQPFVLGCS